MGACTNTAANEATLFSPTSTSTGQAANAVARVFAQPTDGHGVGQVVLVADARHLLQVTAAHRQHAVVLCVVEDALQ